MVVIPFSFLPGKILEFFSTYLMRTAKSLQGVVPYIQVDLDRADMEVEAKRYLAMCLVSLLALFLVLSSFLVFFLSKIGKPLWGVIITFFFCLMIFLMQLQYPKIAVSRRIRQLDADLLAALRTMMIQLNSGVPLFETMVIISRQKFGEVSREFQKAVKRINAGVPQTDALETMALKNPSPYFRRTIWQIINGLKSGAPTNKVIEEVMSNLAKEQVIQIEKYGSQLNPLAMFYMMFAVVLPALSMTLLIVLASFVEMNEFFIKTLFWCLLGGVAFLQIIFLGLIKMRRPSLLGE